MLRKLQAQKGKKVSDPRNIQILHHIIHYTYSVYLTYVGRFHPFIGHEGP